MFQHGHGKQRLPVLRGCTANAAFGTVNGQTLQWQRRIHTRLMNQFLQITHHAIGLGTNLFPGGVIIRAMQLDASVLIFDRELTLMNTHLLAFFMLGSSSTNNPFGSCNMA